MRNAFVVVAILTLAVAGFFAAASLRRNDPRPTPTIPVGKALEFGSSWQVKAPMAKGQEVIDLYGWVKNKSDVAVKLKEIRPREGGGVPENGQLLDLFLVPGRFEQGGLYNTMPPVVRRRGKCVLASIEPVEGYVLEPGESASIGMRIRATRVGNFRLSEREFLYEQGGRRYEQRDSSGYLGRVRNESGLKRTYAELTAAERTCRGVDVLPRP